MSEEIEEPVTPEEFLNVCADRREIETDYWIERSRREAQEARIMAVVTELRQQADVPLTEGSLGPIMISCSEAAGRIEAAMRGEPKETG